MNKKILCVLLAAITLFSCKREKLDQNEQYIVSASKMIGLTGINWNNAESALKNKLGYQYIAAQPNAFSFVKAEIRLPATDDSSRFEQGHLYLNVTPDNLISFALYNTDPIPLSAAYAMMLNYHSASLKILTGITNVNASHFENNLWVNATVADILEKLRNGQMKDLLTISYRTLPRGTTFTMILRKQDDGRYIFEYKGNW